MPEDPSYSEEERICPQYRKKGTDTHSPILIFLLMDTVGFGFAEFEQHLQEGRRILGLYTFQDPKLGVYVPNVHPVSKAHTHNTQSSFFICTFLHVPSCMNHYTCLQIDLA